MQDDKLKLVRLAKIKNKDFVVREKGSMWYQDVLNRYNDLQNGLVYLTIEKDSKNNYPIKLKQYIYNTIDFIKNNEQEIINQVYNLLLDIYPKKIEPKIFKNRYYKDNFRYPVLENIKSLNKIVSLDGIEITEFHKEEQSYYTLNFLTSWDIPIDGTWEYGFHLLMHKTNVIDWGAAWNHNIDSISEIIK